MHHDKLKGVTPLVPNLLVRLRKKSKIEEWLLVEGFDKLILFRLKALVPSQNVPSLFAV